MAVVKNILFLWSTPPVQAYADIQAQVNRLISGGELPHLQVIAARQRGYAV